MTFPTVDYTGRFADFMGKCFPNAACPPLPKKSGDLPATIEMTLQNEDPALYQNLFGGKSGALPADVQNRFNQNCLLPRDAQALREHGFEYYAQQCEQVGAQADDLRLQQKAEEGRKLYLEQKKAQEEWSKLPLGHPAKAPSPESVQRAREEWGITGRHSWE
tara:strand:+ start:73 stop:558 length:486 start_codon:yes stop_codon:yes gene_type:complete